MGAAIDHQTADLVLVRVDTQAASAAQAGPRDLDLRTKGVEVDTDEGRLGVPSDGRFVVE